VTQDNGVTGSEQAELRSDEDDALWQELRMVIQKGDPVPPEVLQAARESFTWRTIDAELAALTYDSAVDDPATSVVRGLEGPRMLSFEASELSVELEVTAVGARRRLVGQLVPPQPARVEVRNRAGRSLVQADELGRFRIEEVAAGPSSLRCHLTGPHGTVPVVTDWITL
jgi:hypothetical protein